MNSEHVYDTRRERVHAAAALTRSTSPETFQDVNEPQDDPFDDANALNLRESTPSSMVQAMQRHILTRTYHPLMNGKRFLFSSFSFQPNPAYIFSKPVYHLSLSFS